jgi:hypothetical protein
MIEALLAINTGMLVCLLLIEFPLTSALLKALVAQEGVKI